MEGLKVSDTSMVVYVHPSKSANLYGAVLQELSSLLFTYSEKLDGVVLAYEFNVLDKTVKKIMDGLFPYLVVRLKAKLFLFAPKPNMLLEGKVVKVTQESIHLIILGFASAVIADEDIRKEFKYKINKGEGAFRSKSRKRHVINAGTMIRFLVKSFEEDVLHISGSLIPEQTGSLHWLARHLEDDSVADRSNMKRQNEEQSALQDHGALSGEPSSVNNEHRIRKSKKAKRIKEES